MHLTSRIKHAASLMELDSYMSFETLINEIHISAALSRLFHLREGFYCEALTPGGRQTLDRLLHLLMIPQVPPPPQPPRAVKNPTFAQRSHFCSHSC